MINPDAFEFLELGGGWKAFIDADVYEWAKRYKWYAKFSRKRVYTVRNDRSGGNHRIVKLHTEIMPPKSGVTIDHVNAETPFCVLDERRSNLRHATLSEQAWNQRVRQRGKDNFKGVIVTRSGKWAARIRQYGKLKYLGTFDSPKSAASAYDSAAKNQFGAFAKCNFPNP